jgi:hypothetical protein
MWEPGRLTTQWAFTACTGIAFLPFIKKVQQNQEVLKLNGAYHLMACADDNMLFKKPQYNKDIGRL